jgi:metal-sulfur cluster biosynthetic enzyme
MTTQAQVAEVLRHVFDPELAIDIVSLGLVYGIDIEGDNVTVRMTTTTPACPMGDALVGMAEAVLWHLPIEGRRSVQLVYTMPWNVRMATPAALQFLGLVPA